MNSALVWLIVKASVHFHFFNWQSSKQRRQKLKAHSGLSPSHPKKKESLQPLLPVLKKRGGEMQEEKEGVESPI